ncbi:MAG TPA: hypothetical protein VEZ15_01810 [Acidimicrobiia bacterium]|nr:hypothetical protein [Acidimicrobiia bacterium]
MQTLRPPSVPTSDASAEARPRRGLRVAAAIAALVIVTAAVSYAVAASRTGTTKIVRIETGQAATGTKTPAVVRNCIAGAAPGSCNTDEYAESKIPNRPLDPATRVTLASQLVAARAAALRYPTVADARRAGMLQAGEFSPETGAHFIDMRALGPFNPSTPGSYIYDGTSPTSKVIGLMYLSLTLNPPEGFAGPNDHWHRHTNTCVVYQHHQIVVPFAADSDVTREQCDGVHGDFMRETVWMVHAWVVPGWENQTGVFAHNNTDVRCADGTSKTDAVGFCRGT